MLNKEFIVYLLQQQYRSCRLLLTAYRLLLAACCLLLTTYR